MAHHNLHTVVRFEFLRTLKKKSFWVSTLIVPVVVGIVFGLVSFSGNSASKSVSAQENAAVTFSYLDESGLISDKLGQDSGGTPVTDRQVAIDAVRAGASEAFIYVPQSPARTAIQVYGKDLGLFESAKYSAVATRMIAVAVKDKVNSPELTALAAGKVSFTQTMFKDGKVSGGIFAVIPPLLFLGLFYLVILFLGNQILNSTVEEKENRVTEMILTTLNPTTLIIGKILAILATGAVQMLTVGVPAAVGFVLLRGHAGIPDISLAALVPEPSAMIVGALLLTGGFILFSAALVAIGSVMPTAKDANGMFGTIVIMMFVPLYAVPLILSDPGSRVVQIFTYFPFSAPVTAMLRNGLGSLSGIEATIVITELFILGAAAIAVAVKLFRHGSIQYTSKVRLRTALSRR
ncbi:ABC transporter permease [Paeniglutamicibacter antarcticus]|uniref:ABC transporter permease n=1 Tax=Arthrobacter terrae TaxID=2935737 RepID=A0A931G3S6_9MICC|nr:ABC transporter permease [Arthrobacter terrae]MBG0739001.1 ABC transporter permease [Arthrobacter terrae]